MKVKTAIAALVLCAAGSALAQDPDQIVATQIQQALDAELAAKGLTKTDADTADLYVGYQVALNQEKQWNAYGGGMGTATSPKAGK